jgi:hypothetical protein
MAYQLMAIMKANESISMVANNNNNENNNQCINNQ